MARTAITLNNPIVKFADDQLSLATAPAFECQITSAVITPVPVTNTIPSTGCASSTEPPGRTGFQIDLGWLQDWGATNSMSEYAWDNDTQLKWYSLALDSIGLPGQSFEGQAYVVAGAVGGTFGDGSAAVATATWPCLD